MVKPIDSSKSKGISKVEKVEGFEEAYKIALDNSRGKKFEKFIVQDHDHKILNQRGEKNENRNNAAIFLSLHWILATDKCS